MIATHPVEPVTPASSPSAIPNPVWSTYLSRPNHVVLEYGSLSWKAHHLAEAMLASAGRLTQGGVRPGERVALCGPPSPEWVIAFHALGWIGASVIPLPHDAPPPEHQRRLAALPPDHVILTHGLAPEVVAALVENHRHARFVTELPPGPAPAERFWPLEEPRVFAFSSGSSGASHPVALTTAQLAFSAFGSAVRLGHAPDDRWLACLPFHHVGGLSILLRCAFYATTCVLQPRFDPRAVAKLLDSGEVSMVSLVPAMLERVLDAREEERPFPSALRVVLLGGDAAPTGLVARCRALAAPIALTWGLTETASQVATRAPGDLADESGCGAPLPFARVRSEGETLEVLGPLAGGRLATRDLGRVDRHGRVHVRGRAAQFIVSGGETVALREIEELVASHPAVAEAAVLGVPDTRWGERPVAALVPRDPQQLPSNAELRAWCAQRLSTFKVPDAFYWLPALPRTSLGKVARGQLRAQLPVALRVSPEDLPAPARAGASPEASPAPGPDPVLQTLVTVAHARCGDGLGARLEEVSTWLQEDLRSLDADLGSLVAELGEAPTLEAHRAAGHLLGQAGKRLRPLCVLLTARAGGRTFDTEVRSAAVAAELVHTATLLHDDVIDEGRERRGVATAREVYGNSASVLGGDHLLTSALRRVSPLGGPVLDRLLQVIGEMVEAEAVQLDARSDLRVERQTVLRVIGGKTASLFRWSFWVGGYLAGLSPETCASLERAGQALGMAFQLIDDVIDIEGDPAITGKDPLADLRQGKLTWPVLLAAEQEPAVGATLLEIAALPPGPEAWAALTRLRSEVVRLGAVQATRAAAEAQGALALEALSVLPPGAPRALLEASVAVALERSR
ncbi:MAG: polyprenyl synthetase family protein [Planctomycetes bacterium]|nr:polyprenyl synthetase family protein [Planctomycetota bacterium]